VETEVNNTRKRYPIRGDLIETFKMITFKENVDKHQFFEFRNNPYKRNQIVTWSTIFSQCVVDSWNRLPGGVVAATSIMFSK